MTDRERAMRQRLLTRSQINEMAVSYLARCMGMERSSTDQDQNWILGHLAMFADSVLMRNYQRQRAARSKR
jgi:hypothetical protein